MNDYVILKDVDNKAVPVAILCAETIDIADAALHQAVDVMDWDKFVVEEMSAPVNDNVSRYLITEDSGGTAYVGGEVVSCRNLSI